MPDARLETLRRQLHAGGVARRYIDRTLAELGDHYADLEADALAAGCAPSEAARRAAEALGTERTLAAAVLARPELRAWTYHWPRTARWLRAAGGGLAAAPAAPIHYLADHGSVIARWGVSAGLAALITSGLLLWLHSLIAAVVF